MAIYLNQNSDKFISYKNDDIFVDKSLLIKETNASLNKESKKFMCLTRPRRFGKTMALNLLNAYYSKGCSSRGLFEDLAISRDPSFEKHLNKHNVFCIDMSSLYTSLIDKSEFVPKLRARLLSDFQEAYPSIDFSTCLIDDAFSKIKTATGDRFIFLIDEWDVIYREEEQNKKLCDEYTEFLRSLFKSGDVSSNIDLVYMTGILPIRRYSTQSTLNMFVEYNMLDPDCLAPLFGFTAEEVQALCDEHGMGFTEIKSWYDGYKLGGIEIYNPKSVVEAMDLKRCGNYWTKTSAIEAVTDYMNFDHGALKGEIVRMLNGEAVELNPDKFSNDLTIVNSRDAALTVLVHLGYLAYLPPKKGGQNGSCYIPNEEIRGEFENAIEALGWKDIYDPISNSPKLCEETFKGNLAFINETLDRNHKEMASFINKNDENVLAVIVSTSYYKARDYYRVKQEDTCVSGRSDLSFFPTEPGHLPFIIELKVGHSPDEAIEQIKRKRYWEAFPEYKGKVLLVGISYDEATLKHSSKVEWIEVK